MSAKTVMTMALSVLAALAVWTVGSRAVLGDPAPAVDAAAAATAAEAAVAGADAAKADPAALARAKKNEKVKKLGCFQCHSFETYLNGKPKAAKPPGGAAEIAAPSGCVAGSAGQGECRPALQIAQADSEDEDEEAEDKGKDQAKPAAAKGEEKGEDGDEEADKEEEEEDAPPDPKDFAHGPHEEEGVGHCHQCHAMEGHFQVKVRMEACAACH
jgi:hypothetical protein